MERQTLFADIIVPAPIPKLFTYRVPFELNTAARRGKRAIIQFGRKKILTGVIHTIHESPPKLYEAKYILEILDDEPTVLDEQVKLIEWCSDYYMSTPGEVLVTALPSGLKLSSQSFIQLHPEMDVDHSSEQFSDKEYFLLSHLKDQELVSYDQIAELLEVKNVYQIIKSLVTKGAILLVERVKEKYQPKKTKKVRLTDDYADQMKMEALFRELEKKPKQTDLLLQYLNLVPIYSQPELNETGAARSELLKSGCSPSSLSTLIRHGIFEEFEEVISRLPHVGSLGDHKFELSDVQSACSNDILKSFQSNDVTLLHGVTGSGKTEIYIKLMEEAISNGGQVLYMLPEIALTTQIVKRLLKVFGDRLGIYHSKYSDNERVEVWQNMLLGQYDVIVGVRSSVFLPFKHLGLIIVDEEHESSYKQFDQAPRYHARDTAIVLGRLHHSKVLIGSATPSLESYQNALEGKYGLVNLNKRFGNATLPEIRIANVLEGRKKKTVNGEFTQELLGELNITLEKKKQSIIFQNRRGYSPYLSCDECAHVPKCQNCSVSLTYHMHANVLRCHYCGYKEPSPKFCASCGSARIRTVGIGTEKIEEDLKLLFDNAVVERMDLDTTRTKYGHQQLIDRFERGEIDILVGTQMITKGLDFDHVRLVGVVDLDRMLHFPDFRSGERCFQLVTQVSGRAGRREEKGIVIIQTTNPYQPIIDHLIDQDYTNFFRWEIEERRKYEYPPFYRLIKIQLKHKEQLVVEKASAELADRLKQTLGPRILGPRQPFIYKVRNYYLMEILVKLEKPKIKLGRVKELLKDCVSDIKTLRELKSVIINFDVDPL